MGAAAAVSANIANEANETAAHGTQIENEILQLRVENAELNDADVKLSAQYDRDQLYCERLFDESVKFREQASLGIQAFTGRKDYSSCSVITSS